MPVATVLSGGFALNNTPPATPGATNYRLPLMGVGLITFLILLLGG